MQDNRVDRRLSQIVTLPILVRRGASTLLATCTCGRHPPLRFDLVWVATQPLVHLNMARLKRALAAARLFASVTRSATDSAANHCHSL